jgi:DNA-nicking Smr family endonuclease
LFQFCYKYGDRQGDLNADNLKNKLIFKTVLKVNYVAMRGKRKKNRADRGKPKEQDNAEFFNKPFDGLAGGIKDFDGSAEPVSEMCMPEHEKEESDDALFQKAMKGVKPLKGNKDKVVKLPAMEDALPDRLSGLVGKKGEDFSVLIKESAAWDISFSDEYMEGAVSGVGPKTMKRLKRGDFSVQDHIDLHGLTKKEAEVAVGDFLVESYQKGLRCVLIVHGRGLRSANSRPAIKRELPVWLKRGILKKIVLAFATARPFDGGAGASYVLLKK